jgi:hypothetical protein
MLSRARTLVQQWSGIVALFLVLTTGSAYALAGSNTVFSDDIVDGQVKAGDIDNGSVDTAKIAANQVKTGDIGDGEVKSPDVANGALGADDLAPASVAGSEIKDNAITGGEVANNSLKGADVDEATLDIGDTARAYAFVYRFGCTIGTPGTCTPAQSKGISSVTRDSTGTYCVTAPGINANHTPAAVTVDSAFTTHPGGNASAMTYEFGACGASDLGFIVRTERQPAVTVDSGGGTNDVFVAGRADLANDIAFTIVIP